MAQNLIASMGNDPNIDESKFCMLWNAILNYHFPLDKDYGVSLESSTSASGTKPAYLVVKIARAEEHVVLISGLKKPLEETEAGKEKLTTELVEYIEKRFEETKFSCVYGLGSIGLSWTAFRVDKAGSYNPRILVPWRSNVTSSWAFDTLKDIVSEIHKMTTPHVTSELSQRISVRSRSRTSRKAGRDDGVAERFLTGLVTNQLRKRVTRDTEEEGCSVY
ncbi:hypothetical protein GALMADRAFT_213966 [Galerina marginata CBS 339.88]|uniref:Fungal-type protein kinase domain-containing protein n=1 Tax=Galerina marginata (strain CBS 339.88) TaxID=685588 RepID=A0A067SML5_GALM3|nr:hypothetical protein GALMADRAFT_213966 [Galerina marginata CBS 339.88]